jgi:hypothetical protein
MVSKLFSIYSFLYVFLDPNNFFHFGEELTKKKKIVQMRDNVVYVKPMFLNISGIKNQIF